MKVLIRETQKEKTLSLIDPKTGCNYVSDFLGNNGALSPDTFHRAFGENHFSCDQATYDWWLEILCDEQELNNAIHDLSEKYGRKAVHKAIYDAELDGVCIEDRAKYSLRALAGCFPPESHETRKDRR